MFRTEENEVQVPIIFVAGTYIHGTHYVFLINVSVLNPLQLYSEVSYEIT
jgi:hypothetical protein